MFNVVLLVLIIDAIAPAIGLYKMTGKGRCMCAVRPPRKETVAARLRRYVKATTAMNSSLLDAMALFCMNFHK